MQPLPAIMKMVLLVSKLAPVLMPQILSIVKSVDGMNEKNLMTIAEFESAIREAQANVKEWDDKL